MYPKRLWVFAIVFFVFGVAAVFLFAIPTRQDEVGLPAAELSESEIVRLANDALMLEYSGRPEQVAIRRSTIGALERFDCGKIGAMISVIVSPLKGNPDICAPDTFVWVVTLRGTFRRADFTTESVQVILDRTGRMMAVDSGELIPNSAPAY